jgi:holliday junction DNA helicase RuvA
VGPSLALAILSVHTPPQLHAAIAADDVAALCLVPGVGKKTATRLLIELKSRLDLPDVVDLAVIDGHRVDGGGAVPSTIGDAREALANLGYSPEEIRPVLAQLDTDGHDAAALVRAALKLLAVRV